MDYDCILVILLHVIDQRYAESTSNIISKWKWWSPPLSQFRVSALQLLTYHWLSTQSQDNSNVLLAPSKTSSSTKEKLWGRISHQPRLPVLLATIVKVIRPWASKSMWVSACKSIKRRVGKMLASLNTNNTSGGPREAYRIVQWPSLEHGSLIIFFIRKPIILNSLLTSYPSFLLFCCNQLFGFRYPTDTDKHILASQTGLSRNQVGLPSPLSSNYHV